MTPSLFRVVVAAVAASAIPFATIAWSSAQERSDAGRLTITIVSSRPP